MKPFEPKYRHNKFQSIGESIQEYLRLYKIEHKVMESAIIDAWPKIMGATIASRTLKVYFYKGTFYVQVNSAPLKHQLNLSKEKIKHLLNEEVGENIVQEVQIR